MEAVKTPLGACSTGGAASRTQERVGLVGGVAAEGAPRLQADPLLRAVPIVFLTATVSQTEAHRGVKSGGFSLLAKLVSMPDLLACLAEHVGPTVASSGSPPPAAGELPRPMP